MSLHCKFTGETPRARNNPQDPGPKHSNDTQLPVGVHPEPRDHDGGYRNENHVQHGVDGRVPARPEPDVAVDALLLGVELPEAPQGPLHQERLDDVREGEQHVEGVRGPEEIPQPGPGPLEEALVREEDGRLAGREREGVGDGAGKVELPENGEFAEVEGPEVTVLAVVTHWMVRQQLGVDDWWFFFGGGGLGEGGRLTENAGDQLADAEDLFRLSSVRSCT